MINQLNDYCRRAENGEINLTKFLDLDELKQVKAYGENRCQIFYFGGYQDAERKRAIIGPIGMSQPLDDEFKIAIYHFTTNPKFGSINHRHILGTIMSMGLVRNTFGDIIVYENDIYLMISEEIKAFIERELTIINRQSIKLNRVYRFNQVAINEENIQIIVPSMRIDVIIARCCKMGRNKATELITQGKVLLNHSECLEPDQKCKVNDILSIRHFGRIKIIDFIKTTKKDRLVLLVGVKH